MRTALHTLWIPALVLSLSCGGDEAGSSPQPSATGATGAGSATTPSTATATSTGDSTAASSTESTETTASATTGPVDEEIKELMEDPTRPDLLKPIVAPVVEEPEPEAEPEVQDADVECATHLAALQELANGQIKAGMGDPLPTEGWLPSAKPGAESREWKGSGYFDTLGWKPDGKVYGSYKITTNASGYTVKCITDIDGDGAQATWTVGGSGAASRTTAEGIR